jgi:DNA-binding CsgD family transcriptional regulator
VLHAVFGVYIACFAGGVTLIVVSWFASRRLALRGLRDFSLLFIASTLILIVDGLKTYELAVRSDFGPGLHIAGIVLSSLGNAGIGWYLPTLALEVTGILPTRSRPRLRGGVALVLACLGGMNEATALAGWGAGPGRILWNADYLALLGVQIYVGAILILGFSRIKGPPLRGIVRAFLVYVGAFAALALAQLVVQDLPSSPIWLRRYPLEQLLYYLGFTIGALFYIARYVSVPVQAAGFDLSTDFVRRFNISNRERDIIEMMAKGFSNSAIAEKLYISSMTVKNHIYHIYRKTGAGNKIQLLNMLNSLK